MWRRRGENGSPAAAQVVNARHKTELINLSDAAPTLSDLESDLASNDWSVRSAALESAASQVREPSADDFSSLGFSIARCITDVRSSLVRPATAFVIACARALKGRYVSSVKVVVPALFKQLSNGTAIVADSCHGALIEVARHVQNRRTVTAFLGFAASKSREHRLVVAEALAIWAATWPDSITGPAAPNIARTLKALTDDASAEVRKAAREVLHPTPMQPKKSPTRPKSAFRSSSPAPRSPNKVRFVDFVEMPEVCEFEQPKSIMKRPKPPRPIEAPKSMADAEALLQVLVDIVAANGCLQKLSAKREGLPEIVVAAVQFIPEFEDWQTVLTRLFETFTEEFF
jgi:hypothetical protein